MIKILLVFAVLLMFSFSCHKNRMGNLPACIQAKIEVIKNQPKWNPPAVVTEYKYNGKRVFAFSADCCDQFNTVVDENCNYICAPSGGIAGHGDGRCTDFAEKAVLVGEVWKDER